MTDRPVDQLDARLADLLTDYGDRAVATFDASGIAHAALTQAAGQRARLGLGPASTVLARLLAAPDARETAMRRGVAASWLSRDRRGLGLLAAAVLAAGALLVGLLAAGARRNEPPTTAPSADTSAVESHAPQTPSPGPTANPSASPSPVATSGPPSIRGVGLGVTTRTGAMHIDRSGGRAAVLLADGRVLVAGGSGQGEPSLGDAHDPASMEAEIFDPELGSWSATASLGHTRWSGQSLTLLRDGRVLLTGGSAYQQAGNRPTPRDDAELFDPTTDTWSDTAAIPGGRSHHIAMMLRDGRVLVVGGYDGRDRLDRVTQIYDPVRGTWSAGSAPSRNAVTILSAALLKNGRVLAVGVDSEGGGDPCAAYVYDPDTDTWARIADGLASCGPRLVVLADGRVLALSGSEHDTDRRSATVYDPVANTWTRTATPPRRLTGAAVLLGDGRVLVSDAAGGALYDSTTGTWTDADLPDANQLPGQHDPDTATVLRDGRVLLTMGTSIFLYTPAP